ncbi:hypothetical protein [Blastopirellula marina]|uniref:Uncharacterized protein n=1 Tax=Blastopirellula marina TaxID=124 RepID=A0A2S8F4H9_9BACT|nr:hypothetical protein [Blastopirellula marina]PQO27072.1 hypothetical protein C5Y98_27860 [Blastopirellula marina]PTL41219.1 hypothetical protein C5Y97_27875 [Blastopirellula marina]
MSKFSAAQIGKTALTIVIMTGVLGVAFGESVYKKACYLNFLALESFPTMNPMQRDKLVSQIDYEDEIGLKHRLFVFESPIDEEKSSCRVLVTDEDYRVTSSWNADRSDKLLNVGFMDHTHPPVLEIVRCSDENNSLVCEHLCLHMGVLQSFEYKPTGSRVTAR